VSGPGHGTLADRDGRHIFTVNTPDVHIVGNDLFGLLGDLHMGLEKPGDMADGMLPVPVDLFVPSGKGDVRRYPMA